MTEPRREAVGTPSTRWNLLEDFDGAPYPDEVQGAAKMRVENAVDEAAASVRAEIAEKVRALPVSTLDGYVKRIRLADVLALLDTATEPSSEPEP